MSVLQRAFSAACLIMLIGLSLSASGHVSGILGHFLSSGDLAATGGDLHLIRTDIDLTGDGMPEVFLSQTGTWMKNGFRWEVYERSAGAGFTRLGSVVFNERYVRVPEPNVLRVLEPRSLGRFWLVEYVLAGEELEEVSRIELSEAVEAEAATIHQEDSAIRQFWRTTKPPVVRADLTPGGLEPWRDVTTGKRVTGLAPIGGEAYRSASAVVKEGVSFLEHLGERRPCHTPGCEIHLELQQVTGDEEPELLVSTSGFMGAPRLVYLREDDGYRFLGELPRGLWRLDDQGRVVVVRSDPTALETYRLTSKGFTRIESVLPSTAPQRVERERQELARNWMGQEPYKNHYRVSWEKAASTPSEVPWLIFKTREPAQIEVDLSLPVIEPGTGHRTER